jgi:hypothetical protein
LAEHRGDILFHTLKGNNEWLKLQEQLRTFRGNNSFCKGNNGKAKPFIWKKREVKGSQLRNTIWNIIS